MMSVLDRFLFLLALLLAVSGSAALYTQAQEAERLAGLCQKMQLLQVAAYYGD
jgi:hypothetical protein